MFEFSEQGYHGCEGLGVCGIGLFSLERVFDFLGAQGEGEVPFAEEEGEICG